MPTEPLEIRQREIRQPNETEWVAFQGGELEGRRPTVLCRDCRRFRDRTAEQGRPLCFHCYRAELERARALDAAGRLDTASELRFQVTQPFDPVNTLRLAILKNERAASRQTARHDRGRFADRRRRAQIAARRALQTGSRLRVAHVSAGDQDRVLAAAFRAAELQLPKSWLPFVRAI